MQSGAMMTDNPSVGEMRAKTPEDSHAPTVAACVGIVALIAGVDFFTANVNISILYALPVLLISQTRHRVVLQVLVVSVIVLTYAGYLLGPRPQGADGGTYTFAHMIGDWRMFNRSLAAIAVCAITAISAFEHRFHRTLQRRREEVDAMDSDARIYEEILESFTQLVAVIASVVIVAVVAIADFITPAQYNLPILYGVPLVICAMTRRRLLLWGILPILLVMTFAGYVIGPSSTVPYQIGIHVGIREPAVVIGSSAMQKLPTLLTNRTLAACVMLGSALLLHCLMQPAGDGRRVQRLRPAVAL
ncbi:MAG TPA: hypothetical protein VF669_15460 [Tepidisphaeraceae bacterium]|jgi:hypothetical protein